MSDKDFIFELDWHSSTGMDDFLSAPRYYCKRILNTKMARGKFLRASESGNVLIHKATKALWKFSDDKKYIEPVFDDDVLSEEDL